MKVIELKSDYEPGAKQSLFHSSPAKYKVLKGAYGSGKSRMAVEEAKILLAEFPGIVIYLMRKTMPSLRDSTLHEFEEHWDIELGKYNGRTEQFDCVNGSEMRCRGLDQPWKIKGSEPAVIILDEADEFTREDFITLKGRIRQVNRKSGKPYPLHMILLFNPVDEDHWLYQEFVKNAKAYEEDGGLLLLELSTYDNVHNLPANYIQQVTVGLTPEEVERYIFGKWGSIVKGAPVYRDAFNGGLHLKTWKYQAGTHQILRGWDFGFNRPCMVVRLKDPLGRKNIDFEMMGDREVLEVFAPKALKAFHDRYGFQAKVFDFCDPRGFDKSDKGSTSVEILNGFGVFPVGERGIRSYVEPGIKIVRKELSTLIAGEPELTINPECLIIKAAYGGRYVRDDNGEIKKDGFYEHAADADRYIAYNDGANSAVREAMINRQQKTHARLRLSSKYTGYR